jgi:NitT/TauT family transport system substrate-binding protein
MSPGEESPTPMQRSAFLGALTATALAGTPSLVAAQSSTHIRIATAPDPDVVAALWGVQSGAFAQSGLDVTIQPANSGAAVAAAVAGGSLEIGKSSLISLLAARSRGLPFVLVAAAAVFDAGRPDSGMIVAKGSPLKRPRDLSGKTVSVQSLNDLNAVAMSAWIDADGGDSKTVKFLEIPAAAATQAVASGRVDGSTLSMIFCGQAVAGGTCRLLGHPFEAIAKRFVYSGFFCTADFASKNATALDAFRRVMAQSGAYILAHRSETVPLVAKFTGLDEKVIASVPVEVATKLDLKLIQPLIDKAITYKLIPNDFDLRAMIGP